MRSVYVRAVKMRQLINKKNVLAQINFKRSNSQRLTVIITFAFLLFAAFVSFRDVAL